MMYRLYDITLHLGFAALSPYFIGKAAFVGKYRHGLSERFGHLPSAKLATLHDGKVIWFHAVSVGETKAVMPLLKKIKERHPDIRVVLSTVTATGNAVALKEGEGLIDLLLFFPLDFSWVVKRVIRRVCPSLFVIVEKEIWPNFLRVLNDNKVPVIVINGNLSDRSFRRYIQFRFLFSTVFNGISAYCAQTKADGERASILGVPKALVTGNIKFDIEAIEIGKEEEAGLRRELGIGAGEQIVVAGSTHRGEEEKILTAFLGLREKVEGARLVIAPRHPERFREVGDLIEKRGFRLLKRSDNKGKVEAAGNRRGEVILLDTLGELVTICGIADLVFVGGSLVEGVGGHNLLEPAIYRKPVLYGPHLGSWRHIAKMLERGGGGIRVDSEGELLERMIELLSDAGMARKVGEAAYRVAAKNRGATEKSLEVIEGFLKAKSHVWS
ncbi:MAG: 3-deoxy-D-manno-octulosonic acid transferase [Deltaproteobacteria bacterium]|nr:3-deoxy-D-manno-octulosonic acid transferase [Deltaproteobacteria bacterium]